MDIESVLDDFREQWWRSKRIGMRHPLKLPEMTFAEAEAAKASARAHYYKPSSRWADNRVHKELYRETVEAINAALPTFGGFTNGRAQ